MYDTFLDDCYIALDTTIVNLSKLFETLNSIHKDIKFMIERHDIHLPFHHILINKDSETKKVWIDIFYKKTDIIRWVGVIYLVRTQNFPKN